MQTKRLEWTFGGPGVFRLQKQSFCSLLEYGLESEFKRTRSARKTWIKEQRVERFELGLLKNKYIIKSPTYTLEKAKKMRATFGVQICKFMYVKNYWGNTSARVKKNLKAWRKEWLPTDLCTPVRLIHLPLMTDLGSFFINGNEWVLLSQTIRAPGVYLAWQRTDRCACATAEVLLMKGPRLRVEIEEEANFGPIVYFKGERSKKSKVPAGMLLRALGLSNEKIITSIFDVRLFMRTVKFGFELTKEHAHRLLTCDDALGCVYHFLWLGHPGPGDIPASKGLDLLYALCFDPRKVDTGLVGRARLNSRLNHGVAAGILTITIADIIALINRVIRFYRHGPKPNDIEHFTNRRVRGPGELLQEQIRVGLSRMKRILFQKAQIIIEGGDFRPVTKSDPIMATLRDFFESHPLFQFLDQLNPLSEISHKRKVSMLGPGGLLNTRVGIDLREVHYSQYNRFCSVEISSGQQVGLVLTLTVGARLNGFGFAEAPFYKVLNSQVLNNRPPHYMDAAKEISYRVGTPTILLNFEGYIISNEIVGRYKYKHTILNRQTIEYVVVSPSAFMSVGCGLVPFLEHNDATRILMGANMQKQAVELLYPQRPYVGTGMESAVAHYSDRVIHSLYAGKVIYADSTKISLMSESGLLIHYDLNKFCRSNQESVLSEKPLVSMNEKVFQGQVLTDGVSIRRGELALGQNVLVAYMQWSGMNFEDGMVVSQRLISDDLLSSVHIERMDYQILPSYQKGN